MFFDDNPILRLKIGFSGFLQKNELDNVKNHTKMLPLENTWENMNEIY